MPFARSSHRHRSAIGQTVTIISATAARKYQGSTSARMSSVWEMSTFQTR